MARTTLASDDSSGNPLSLRELERQVLATRAEADRAGNNSAELDQLGHRKFELNRQTMARPISCTTTRWCKHRQRSPRSDASQQQPGCPPNEKGPARGPSHHAT
jgi:hypothetical protein